MPGKLGSILICVLLLGSGCASLTRSQLDEVNAFGKLTCNFSAYPGTIISTYNRVHVQAEIYRANSLPNPQNHFTAIEKAAKFNGLTKSFPDSIDLSLKIIDQYAQALILLTSDKHELKLDTSAIKFGTSLDGLVGSYNKADTTAKLPTGIGSAVAAAVAFGGEALIRTKQADDVKKVVPMGDQIIAKMTDNLLNFLGPENDPTHEGKLQMLIAQEKINVANSYRAYLGLNRDTIALEKEKDKFSGYIKHDRFATVTDDKECLQMLEDLDAIEALRVQCIKAVTALRKAHAKLLKDTQQREKLREYAQELQDYGADIQKVYNGVKAVKSK